MSGFTWPPKGAAGAGDLTPPRNEIPAAVLVPLFLDESSNPHLVLTRRRTDLPRMGGISHGRFAYESAGHIRQQIKRAVEEAGREKLFLAPCCALPSYAFPELIRAAHDAAAR